MNINERAAYLKGLFDGYELDTSKKEVKVLSEALDLIFAMTEKISELEADNAELREYIEEIDEDLGAIEEEFYFVDEDEDEDYEDDEDYEGEEETYYEIECPSCGEIVCFDDSLDTDELICPACGEKMKVPKGAGKIRVKCPHCQAQFEKKVR